MDELLAAITARFRRLVVVSCGGDLGVLEGLITSDYLGHMLHRGSSQRTAETYPEGDSLVPREGPRNHVHRRGPVGQRGSMVVADRGNARGPDVVRME